MNLTIRPARLSDAEAMARLMCRAWEAAYTGILPDRFIREVNAGRLEGFRRNLAEKNDGCYAVCDGEALIGLLKIAPPEADEPGIDERYLELCSIYFDPEAQGKGAGRFAMEFAMEKARAAGKDRMLVWVLEGNTPAIGFYSHCGFRPDGQRQPFPCGRPAFLIRMQRTL